MEKRVPKDMWGCNICGSTDLWIYVSPYDEKEITVELYDSFDSLPLFDARKLKLEDLGMKSVEELVNKIKKDKKFRLNLVRLFNKGAVVDDKYIDCIELSESLSIYRNVCGSAGRGVIKVKIFEDGSGFEIGDSSDGCSWVIKQHPHRPDLVIISFRKFGEEVAFVFRDYDYFSVDYKIKNMEDLINYVKKDPDSAIYFITLYQDFDYDKVEVV